MKPLADVIDWLEAFAPLELAASWDNVGLLLGDPASTVKRVMTCLTVTVVTAREAIDAGADLIVCHHPVLFRPTQRVVAERGAPNESVWMLARAGVAVYSPHTAFDNCAGGINDMLAKRFGLRDIHAVQPAPPHSLFKIVVHVPEADRERVLAAAFAHGAGRVGDYVECSFSISGVGTFRGLEGTSPAIGQAGKRESVDELRVEFVCPAVNLSNVLGAVRAMHSYEEPAIDVYPLRDQRRDAGSGRLGTLEEPCSLQQFAQRVRETLGVANTVCVGDRDRRVEGVAIVCGAGDDLIPEAAKRADVLVTGEARYHAALQAEALGLSLILAGHHATERPGVEMLAAKLSDAFTECEVWASRDERDPMWA